jgi:cytochrome c biogenesis protein CcdA/thiol-disulfide isomerase/thioredoxin
MSLINFALAFLEGLALIVSPCILPILPIVLSVGLAGGKGRPYGLILGFIVSFWVFTLLSRKLVLLLGIDTGIIRQLSYFFLLLLGLLMLSDKLSDAFSMLTQKLANAGQAATRQSNVAQGRSFLAGFVSGLFVGLIWSPCVGPIIASVLVQTIRQTSDAQSALLLACFSAGVGLPMLLITLGGQTVLSKLDRFKRHTGFIRKVLGAVIIATVLFTAGPELFHFPNFLLESKAMPVASPRLTKGLAQPYAAPNFAGISAWINSPPLTTSQLKGKVVLVDFWTYSCINCVRTLPFITAWDQKYRSKGLVIVGVHSPEFDFEKKLSNVQAAVKQHNIQYPVALDNNLDTFMVFHNQYWPAHYLIDRSGKVVYTHFGEGEYQQTENNIRVLLGVNDKLKRTAEHDEKQTDNQTPETYLGSARTENFASSQTIQQNQPARYSFPATLSSNAWALNGFWRFDPQFIRSGVGPTGLRLHFKAKKVFLVLGREGKQPVKITVLLNGQAVTASQAGHDVKNGLLIVDRHALYELLSLNHAQSSLLELEVHGEGLDAYAFTFGG